MTYLTEDPWSLTFVFLVAAVFFAWNGLRTRQKRFTQVAVICALLSIVPPTVDALVQTEREQIVESLNALKEAVIDGDVDRALSFVEGNENVTTEARRVIENGLSRVNVHEGLRVKAIQVSVHGNQATSDFRANGTVDVKGVVSGRHVATRWVLDWQKGAADWKVTKVTRLDPVSGDVIQVFGPGRAP